MEQEIGAIQKQLQQLEERIAALEGRKIAGKKEVVENTQDNLALLIANKVADCDESESIQVKILDKRSADAKVLLCFYISYKYFGNAWLTSGDIEDITTQLGVKIATGNASNKLKELRAYLESSTARKTGSPTPCRLNRNGSKYFEQLLNT